LIFAKETGNLMLMIERYSITLAAETLAEKLSVDVPDFYKPRYNAAPTQLLPVITSNAPAGISLFYWGTSPEWSKNKTPGEKIINLAIEAIEEKPALQRAIKKNRCLIPADGFYIWRKVGKKTSIPYRFFATHNETFSFAGVWEEFEDTDGNEIQTFKLITAPASDNLLSFTDRVPVLLNREQSTLWLAAPEDTDFLAILKSAAIISLNNYPVSPIISNISQDLASMIIPTPPADQHGNLTLFD
jgi:putative SOS response-associated peptidase YedK